jgi:murein DD-endopeptidase MepM/ murein hydrolase activator NlpD
MISKRDSRPLVKNRIISNLLAYFLLLTLSGPSVLALSSSQRGIFDNGIGYFNTVDSSSVNCSTTFGSVSATAGETAIIKIIIGIAKTDNIGKAGATIGLMAADDESGFAIYANSNVPLSLSIPHQAVGSDHNSVGVFQQQPDQGWSTLATGTAALTNRAALAQLMDPAYSAEAFFGSPPNSNAPSALSKGLQNIDWQSMDPAVAASTVQHNLAGASVYANFLSDAESFVNQYWNSSPAIPLPVPLSGSGSPTAAVGDTGSVCSGSSALGIYKNPLRDVQQLRPERIDEGVDYAGEGPVYALGDGVIKNLVNSGWNYGGFDAFISEQLSSGPAKGLYVYVAEACIPKSSLHIGDTVNADTVICNMINPADTGIETGWAAPPGAGAALASPVYNEINSTALGVNYNKLLMSLGAPSGVLQSGAVTGSLPPGWPQW